MTETVFGFPVEFGYRAVKVRQVKNGIVSKPALALG
jgi:hypothetical protein